MKLSERYPDAFAAWEAAGGVESNFESHLVALGTLPADLPALLVTLARLQSATAEVQETIRRMLIPTPEAPPALVHAIDVSSHQPRDLTDIIASLTPRPTHVVVRLYQTGEQPPQEHSLAQIESARANGCTVGAYMWLYARHGDGPREQVQDALALAERAKLEIPVLWIDVEPYTDDSLPDVPTIWQALSECKVRGVRPGIYSGAWVWPKLGGYTGFAEAGVPLWSADYNGRADLDVPLYGGWTQAHGHQYQGSPIDRSVFAPDATR